MQNNNHRKIHNANELFNLSFQNEKQKKNAKYTFKSNEKDKEKRRRDQRLAESAYQNRVTY